LKFETFKRLLYLEKDNTISHTKFWSNIGFFILSVTFICITIYMGLGYTYPLDDWLEFFISFGTLVAAQRGFSKWVSYKSIKGDCLNNEKDKS
jgi:hypothetical protein